MTRKERNVENSPRLVLSGRELAVRAERIDVDNWLSDYGLAPAQVAGALGMATVNRDELAMVRSRIPFCHFNMVMTLGCPARVDEEAFAAIERFYAEGGIEQHWVLVNDFSEPRDLERQLLDRGYELNMAWDRVILQGEARDRWAAHAVGCEIVTAENAGAWSGFLRECYGMPPLIEEWLRALVGAPGWMHVIRREGGQPGGKVVMARSLFQDPEGWAWLGIDAPVPGVMAPCFEDDQKVVATLLTLASARGARAFVSDIEVPTPSRDSEAYRRWGELGFGAEYLRKVYVKTGKEMGVRGR